MQRLLWTNTLLFFLKSEMASLILCRKKKKKKEEKLWANNTGSGKSEGLGLWGIYENIKLHGQNTLY